VVVGALKEVSALLKAGAAKFLDSDRNPDVTLVAVHSILAIQNHFRKQIIHSKCSEDVRNPGYLGFVFAGALTNAPSQHHHQPARPRSRGPRTQLTRLFNPSSLALLSCTSVCLRSIFSVRRDVYTNSVDSSIRH
jgi:hypothetical protein